MKQISLSFTLLAVAVSANAQSLPEFTWTTNNGNITITGFSGLELNVTIPSQITGRTVTAIGAGAFQNNNDMLTVTIPSSVTSIGPSAFDGCTSLEGITIPNGVTTIGDNAFSGCGDLGGTITIPSSVTSLGETVFQGCFFVSAYNVNSGNLDYASAGGVLYNKSMTTLIAFPPDDSATTYNIPSGVTSIAPAAFFGCGTLVTVTNPATLISIGDSAFVGCNHLTGAYFLGNKPTVDTDTFSGDSTTVYYNSGTTGWGSTFGGVHTVKLNPAVVTAPLTVVTNGSGSVTPVDNGKELVVGASYTLTAAPAKNWLFDHWAASGSEDFTTNAKVLKFTMESGLTLTAYFDTNNFVGGQETYNGLFEPPSDSREQTNSGAVTFTVTSTGKVSGKLTIGTNAPSWSGQFDPTGFATVIIPRRGLTTLTVTLQLDFAGQAVTGQVTDGSFTASLWGDQEVFSAKQPANEYKGQYTLVVDSSKDPSQGPFGCSAGTVTVAPTGAISFKGSLADGTTVSQNSFVSKDGRWPLYLPLYNGRGSLWCSNYLIPAGRLLQYSSSWINATNSSKTAVYRSGFTNQNATVYISYYLPSQALPSGFTVTLSGGSLPLFLTIPINVSSSDKVTLTNASTETNKLSMTITKTTGAITGHFADPASPKETINFSGVVLQQFISSTPGFEGYFLQTNGTSGIMVSQ